jgi:hypothetical protein
MVVICCRRTATAAAGGPPVARSEAGPSARNRATTAKPYRRGDKAESRNTTCECIHFCVGIFVCIPAPDHATIVHRICDRMLVG